MKLHFLFWGQKKVLFRTENGVPKVFFYHTWRNIKKATNIGSVSFLPWKRWPEKKKSFPAIVFRVQKKKIFSSHCFQSTEKKHQKWILELNPTQTEEEDVRINGFQPLPKVTSQFSLPLNEIFIFSNPMKLFLLWILDTTPI